MEEHPKGYPLSELSRFTSKITPKLAIGHSQGIPSRVTLVVSLIQAKQHPSECLPIQWSCLSSMQHLDLKIDGKTRKTLEWKWDEMGHFGNESRMENGCLQFETFDRRGRYKFLYPTAEQGCFVVSLLGHVTFLSFRSMSSFFDSEVAFALKVNL